jgi:hypothetical protein
MVFVNNIIIFFASKLEFVIVTPGPQHSNMSKVIKYVANTAFSLTLAGNSDISPFLTMALIGLAGKIQPEYLNLDDTMKWIMTSWPSLCFWCAMTVLETVGKCVPIIDQIMDTAAAFVVPVLVSALRPNRELLPSRWASFLVSSVLRALLTSLAPR